MDLIRRYRQGKVRATDVRKLNYIVLCLMMSLAATSIAWSLAIHVLSGDFYNGFIGAKLVFRERDLVQMENVERNIWQHDLQRVLNETYTIEALDQLKADALVMPKLRENYSSTQKPKALKIAHVFQTKNSKVPESPAISNGIDGGDEDEDNDRDATTKVPKIFNFEQDRKFLSLMTIDIHQTRWPQNFAVKFIYSFPFFSEIIAIIWTVMCFIFQSGVKKTWGVPKPWRIVVPSITIFTIMAVANFTYVILANGFLKTFCHDLLSHLSKPDAISCGDAMAVLRPVIRFQTLSHNAYLILFRVSYILALILWICALVIMLMRFFLAIDFQLVDVETPFDRETRQKSLRAQKLVSVQLNEPATMTTTPANFSVENEQDKREDHAKSPSISNMKNELEKSEDDFQSAKSHLSEVATPLLNQLTSTRKETKT